MFTHFLDDIVEDYHSNMESFADDLFRGSEHKTPFGEFCSVYYPISCSTMVASRSSISSEAP